MVKSKKQTQSKWSLEKIFPFILIVTGVLALVASVMIMHGKISGLENPNYTAVCDINPILSCGSVMDSSAAKIFGFDNTYMGLIGFPIVITIGLVMLAGASLKRWFFIGLQAGMTFTLLFILWLMYSSVFVIGSLCIFCMMLWVSVIVGAWYVTVYNLRTKNIVLPAKLDRVNSFIQKHHVDIIVAVALIIIAIILNHFWYYFGGLI